MRAPQDSGSNNHTRRTEGVFPEAETLEYRGAGITASLSGLLRFSTAPVKASVAFPSNETTAVSATAVVVEEGLWDVLSSSSVSANQKSPSYQAEPPQSSYQFTLLPPTRVKTSDKCLKCSVKFSTLLLRNHVSDMSSFSSFLLLPFTLAYIYLFSHTYSAGAAERYFVERVPEERG
jgi:hypothetical protein